MENLTYTETRKQQYLVAPPLKRKAPQNTFRSYIDQLPDGYGGSKLVRSQPRTTADSYFKFRPRKAKPTEMRSYRRNYSHRSVALFRTKKDGSTRKNIAFMNCSFLELDGSTDGTIKSIDDVLTLAGNNNLLEGLQIIQTSLGNFHLIWPYNDPLPWNERNESFWLSVQKRKIELFQKAGFLVDKMASLNPTQNLRNPSQLTAFNFKRGCQVHIHKTYQKTSLRAIYRALNKAGIPNPKRVQASVKFRRFLRANQTFTLTHKELSINLGTCTKTAQREVRRAVLRGDMLIVQRSGNNKRIRRTTEYLSNLYIEPNSQKGHVSISKNNALKRTNLLPDFQANGTEKGRRNRTVFVLAVGLSCKSNKTASIAEIADQLRGGSGESGLSEKELVRTIKNAVKPVYSNPFSLAKLQDWELLEEPKPLCGSPIFNKCCPVRMLSSSGKQFKP